MRLKHSYLIFLVLASCSTAPVEQEPNPKVYYKRNMKGKVNNIPFQGTIVVPKYHHYNFEIETLGKNNDLVKFETCGGERFFEDVKDKFKFGYELKSGIDDRRICYFRFTALDRKKEKHSFGIMIVVNPIYWKLSAYLKCNLEEGPVGAGSICEAPMGKTQRISFTEKVIAPKDPGCLEGKLIDEYTYEYISPNRECEIVFRSKETLHEHLHVAIGYEEVLFKEVR